MSLDPIEFKAGDPNLYRYVGNGPTIATDPTGMYIYLTEGMADDNRSPVGQLHRDIGVDAWTQSVATQMPGPSYRPFIHGGIKFFSYRQPSADC